MLTGTFTVSFIFLEAQVSFVEEFLDEVWQDEAALLDRSVVVLHRLRNRASYAGTERIMHLGCKHEGMHAGRIDRHVGVVHPDDREYVSHGFVDVMDGLLLHDRGLCLLDDESVFAEGFMRTLVEFAGEKAFTGSDRVGAVDDDDIIEVLDGFRKGDAVSYMDVKLFRRIKERGCNGREVFLESSMTRPSMSQRSTCLTQS